jgi:hypothetical protein
VLECLLGGVDEVVHTLGAGMPVFVSGPAPRGKILRTRLADIQILLERGGVWPVVGVAVYPGSRSGDGVLEEEIDLTHRVQSIGVGPNPNSCDVFD